MRRLAIPLGIDSDCDDRGLVLEKESSIVRPVSASDYRAIRDLIGSKEELFLVYPEGSYPMTVEQVERLVGKRKAPTVLLEEEKVVGFACFYGYREGRFAYVGNVVVDTKMRRRGLGRKIVVHMINTAFEEYALPEVRIAVFSRNTPALLLYSSLGFRPYRVAARRDTDGKPVALVYFKLKRGRLVTG